MATYQSSDVNQRIRSNRTITSELVVPDGLTILDIEEWSGKLSFTDVGAIVYYLKAVPWLVPGFSVKTHSKYLFALQRRLEGGDELAFTAKKYLIEARKDPPS